MCGICGIIDLADKYSPDQRVTWVKAMNQAILHRGPDAGGNYDDNHCALAMRRLSIIDLDNGTQPIFNETQDIGVFFNGEIYNYRELRAELIAEGHQFTTQSDTEVLVHLYESYGTAMLKRLRGMFAFCLFDKKQQTYLLARDKNKKKPLFYHWQDRVLTFSSELTSLLQQSALPRRLNQAALPYYFRTSLLPEPMTMFADVYSLPPGHFMEISQAEMRIEPYFQIKYETNHALKTKADAIAFIQPHLEKAVQRQRISDVPLGAFLSGGIDSSSLVALLQKNSAQPIQTFNARFEDAAFDESKIARQVAERWGTEHHELVIPNYDFTEDLFWTIIDSVGQPFRDSSAIPTYLLTREIRKHVKVAISGDGGDELFGGYDIFQWYQKIIKLKQVPKGLRQFGNYSLSWLQQFRFSQQFEKIRQIKRGVATSLQPLDDIPIALNEFFTAQEIGAFLPANQMDDFVKLKSYPPHICNHSPLRKIMYYRAQHTLPGNMLVKVDRMSMANSLEVRAPFLDPDLFAAAAQLPDRFLIQNGKGKYLLRQMMEK
ncbi:MAG: asparagine synthase (glutamine-hydrolyzing), partial [Saprospiraceae bacterium]